MKLVKYPDCHLTYCTNIHPGESWQQVWSQFRKYLPAVKGSISPNQNFGVGARFSAQAVSELLQGTNLSKLRKWLSASGLYIFTINGFPYGQFHQKKVKENVYLPDWSATTRLEYSKLLAQVLAELLPTECIGTISTVPIGLKTNFLNKNKLIKARDNLLSMVVYLGKLHLKTGKQVKLTLEPEPGCYLETGDDIVAFFNDYLLTDDAIERLRSLSSSSLSPSPEFLLRYLGVCLDTCHTSVMHETPTNIAKLLAKNNIGIYKIQLTAALVVNAIGPESFAILQQLSDPIYLHQTSVSDENGKRFFFLDLPDALEKAVFGDDLRVHYHVPLFMKNIGELDTSQDELVEFLEYFTSHPSCQHLEVETYTFDVLPKKYRHGSVVKTISQELQWVLDTLNK
jgi:hypothetical protein